MSNYIEHILEEAQAEAEAELDAERQRVRALSHSDLIAELHPDAWASASLVTQLAIAELVTAPDYAEHARASIDAELADKRARLAALEADRRRRDRAAADARALGEKQARLARLGFDDRRADAVLAVHRSTGTPLERVVRVFREEAGVAPRGGLTEAERARCRAVADKYGRPLPEVEAAFLEEKRKAAAS